MELIPTTKAIISTLNSPAGRAVLQAVTSGALTAMKGNNQKKSNNAQLRRRNRRAVQNPNPRTVALEGINRFSSNGTAPRISTSQQGQVSITRIVHKEVLATTTSIGEDGNTYGLLPISCKMTPYLMETAHRFNKFRLVSVKFTYQTTCTTGTHGRSVLAPFYDQVTIEDVRQMGLNYLSSFEGARTTAVWQDDPVPVVFDLSRVTSNNLWWDCHGGINSVDPNTNIENIMGFLIHQNNGAGNVDLGIVNISYTIDFATFKPPVSPDVVFNGYLQIIDPHESLSLHQRKSFVPSKSIDDDQSLDQDDDSSNDQNPLDEGSSSKNKTKA